MSSFIDPRPLENSYLLDGIGSPGKYYVLVCLMTRSVRWEIEAPTKFIFVSMASWKNKCV